MNTSKHLLSDVLIRLFALLDNIVESAVYIGLVVTWIAGFVLAKGFWSTLFCFIPFYAWYLDIAYLMAKYGITS